MKNWKNTVKLFTAKVPHIPSTIKIRKGRKSRKSRKNWHGGVKEALKETHFLPFFLCLSPSYKLSRTGGENLWVFRFWAMNLLRRNVVQNARKSAHVQKWMDSVILQFSSMKKVGPELEEHVKRDPHVKSAWLGGSLRSFGSGNGPWCSFLDVPTVSTCDW